MSSSAFERLTLCTFSQVTPVGIHQTQFSVTYNEQLVQMHLLWLEENVKLTTAFAKFLASKISTLEGKDSDMHLTQNPTHTGIIIKSLDSTTQSSGNSKQTFYAVYLYPEAVQHLASVTPTQR